MTKNIKLLLSASTVACFSISLLQGCGSDATDGGTPTPTAGAPAAGHPAAGAPATAGAPAGGAPGAGAPAGGAPAGGAPAGGAPAGGASGGTGGSTAGAGGAKGGAGGAAGAGGTSGAAGAGGAKGGAGGAGGASAGSGGASGGAGGAPSAACTTFCNDEETICTFTAATAAYASKPECLTACATFTPGTGMTGNTLACRQYHVTNASMGADPTAIAASKKTHCPHTAKVSHNDGSPVTMANGPCN